MILDYWDFQLKFRYLNSFPMENFILNIFQQGAYRAKFISVTFFALSVNIANLLMCLFFGLKCLKTDWFWSSFDLLEDVLFGITVPNNITLFFFFFLFSKIQKSFFSLIFSNFNSLWKNEKNMINQVVLIWQYQEPETNKYRRSRRQKWN